MATRRSVVIIGAGPSGLAVGACLARRGIDAVILEQEESVGPRWRRHYQRLHLHTVKQFSALPHHPWPGHVPTYPSRAEVVSYLEDYAARFALAPRFGTTVRSARPKNGAWCVETTSGSFEAHQLVVASGYNRRPHRPVWPGMAEFGGDVLHTVDYRDGAPFRGKRVLVVGSGNSGAEIAIDLWEHGAKPFLCIRGPVHVVPRDLHGAPAQLTGLLMSRLPPAVADRLSLSILDRVIGDLSPWGIRRPAEGPMTLLVKRGRVPLIDVGTVELIKQGCIEVVPGIVSFGASTVRFDDGRELSFDSVLLATGYRAALDEFLADAPRYTDARGYPRWFGEEAGARGLYFVGYRNPPIGQLNDIAREARRVADSITRSA
jgi:hypothetical protein